MITGKPQHRILVVSSTDKICGYLNEILPTEEFRFLPRVGSAGEAKRIMVSSNPDIVIINTPLPDDFGTELALDLSEGIMGILLLVKNDSFDQICYRVESSGILTLSKPVTRQALYSAVRMLAAVHVKLSKLEQKNRTLREKMEDIRVVNRAKWLLIQHLKMSENDAHYYIEKQSMDMRISRKEVADGISRAYDK